MRRTQEEAELTRQTILDAAITKFSCNGYAATRLEDIANAANVTRGAVYHHFSGGKAELFTIIIERATQTSNQAINRAIQEGGLFIDILQRILIYTLELLGKDVKFKNIMSLLAFNSGDSPELAPMRKARLEQGLIQLEQIVGFFRLAHQKGDLRSDLNPEVAARAFLAYQNGLVLLWLSAPGNIIPDQYIVELAEIFIHGLSA